MVTQGHRITAADFTALWTLANGKSSLAGDYGTRAGRLTELNRLRQDIWAYLKPKPNFTSGTPGQLWPLKDGADNYLSSTDDPKNPPADFPFAQVSGPWPLNQPNPFSGKQDFYYPDTGNTEKAAMEQVFFSSQIAGGWGSFGDDEYRNYYILNINHSAYAIPGFNHPAGRFSQGLMKSKRKFAIVLSGAGTVHLKGTIHIPVSFLMKGYTRNVEPWFDTGILRFRNSQPVYATAGIFDLIGITSGLPVQVEKIENYNPRVDDIQDANGNWHYAPGSYSAFVWRFDGDYPAGRYEVELTVPDAGDDTSDFHLIRRDTGGGTYDYTGSYIVETVKSRAEISNAQLYFGGYFGQASAALAAAHGIHNTKEVKCISLTPKFPAICSVIGNPEVVKMYQAPITTTVGGYWLGQGYPVANCFVPANNPNSPLRWAPNTAVPVGCQIYDATGNIWTCTQAGVTGPEEPVAYYGRGVYYWPYTPGATYEELDFNTGIAITGAAKWKLTNLVRTRYETPWLSGPETWPGSLTFIRKVGDICVSRGNDFYQVTKTQTKVDGDWVDSETALEGVVSFNINPVLDEPAWNRTIGNVTRNEDSSTGVDYAVEWTSIFHAGESVKQGPGRVGSQLHSYPCIWDEDGWIANARFNLGRKILESGRIWVCSNAGLTGATKPSFSGDTEVTDNTAKWQLESAVNYFGSEHKERYPLAVAAASGLTQKWFIRQLFLNRVVYARPEWSAGSEAGSSGADFPSAETQNVPVEIGFYRSGTFVSLGNYMTGEQPVVMWPVFTDTPLVYKAGERVDVQASVVRPDAQHMNNYAMALSFPLAAEHYNDTERSLNLI